jgi:hypothetical protein
VSSGTTGLTLIDEIAPKDHFRPPSTPKRLRIQPQQEIFLESPLKRHRLLKENQDKIILKEMEKSNKSSDLKWYAICLYYRYSSLESPSSYQIQQIICYDCRIKNICALQRLIDKVKEKGTWRIKRKKRSQEKFKLVNKTIRKVFEEYNEELS